MVGSRAGQAFPDKSPEEEEALKELTRERSVQDLHYLAKHVLGYDRITDHYHREMAHDITLPGYRFKLLLHARGHFKSTVATEAGAIFKLLREPRERILITNVKLGNSRKFLRAIAHHFNSNPRFRWAWRDWWIDNYASAYHKADRGDKLDWVVRDTQDEFSILRPYEGREASITAGGVDASMVSQHYSSIICDDPINREYVNTYEMVEKSILYFKDLLDLLDPHGELIVIGTKWSYMDLYSWIINEFGHRAEIRAPGGYIDEEVIRRSNSTPPSKKNWMMSIRPCYGEDGQPVFPEEYDEEVLEDLKVAKGPYEFGAQYLLNPTPKEDQKFKEEWFRRIDAMPHPRTLEVCMTVDPAKSLEDRADRSAITIYGYDDTNRMFFLDGLNDKIGEDDLLEAVFEMAVTWQNKAKMFYPVGFEAVGFQETYVHALERMMLERNQFFSIEPIPHRKSSKHERILRLVPRIKNGFYVPRQMLRTPHAGGEQYDLVQRLMWELTRFPRAEYDDLADATADQLIIVPPRALPREVSEEAEVAKPDFVHRSMLEDRGMIRKRRVVSKYTGAVR